MACDREVRSPFGTVEGRADLRGLTLRAPGDRGRMSIGDAGPSRWTALALSGAALTELNWSDHVVSDCVFDDADLTGLRCWGAVVERCSLRRAALYTAQLGAQAPGRSQSRWQDVDLSSADLRRSTASRAILQRARFDGAKLTGAHWTSLVDCSFRGVVAGLTLGGDPVGDGPGAAHLVGVDMTAAKPRGLRLVGVDLGHPSVSLALPSDADHWHVADWPGFLARVAGHLGTIADDDLRVTAEVWLGRARADSGPRQSIGFLARWDLKDLGGPALVELLDGLRSA